jgi:alkanesulfonate monooxygenase SsuD/methylene tetrahydromethanopterin reductase-like flavin-dependent oxidoreductase (luciferase family)
LGVTSRYPGWLVKTVTTMDVLSHGRAYFGVGVAWNEEEHIGLGVPFPPTAERFERLEETLQIAHQMWAGDEKPYQGKQYQLGRPLNSPSSVQKPHLPILIDGGGERKLSVLREHCQTIGRPYTDIEKTIMRRIHLTKDGREKSLTPAAAIAYFRELAAMGFDQAIASLPNVADLEPFDLFATEIIPAVEQIEVAGR